MTQKRDWDVALLGGNYYFVYDHQPEIYSLRLKFSYCTNDYIVNRGYAETLYHTFNDSVQRITADIEPSERKSIDVVWNERMAKDNWFGLYPCIAYQKRGFSDIREALLDYEPLFNKPLSDLTFLPVTAK